MYNNTETLKERHTAGRGIAKEHPKTAAPCPPGGPPSCRGQKPEGAGQKTGRRRRGRKKKGVGWRESMKKKKEEAKGERESMRQVSIPRTPKYNTKKERSK